MTHRPRWIHRRIGSSDSISELSPPSPPAGEDAHVAAQNARLADFKRALRGGTKSIGQVVCAASPTVAAAYVAFGVDWIWIEWQHSCQDAAALPRAGGRHRPARRSLGCSNGGRARQDRHPAMPRCRRRYRSGPVHQYRGGGEGIDQALPVRAPRRPRVERQRSSPAAKKSAVMFQLETSACMDALEEICRQPEMDFGFVGPGDLAMSLGLVTRDSMFGYMKADEVKWCYSYIVETCTAAGKIAGGFTRGGDPSSLLSHGFAMVGLSHDLLDAIGRRAVDHDRRHGVRRRFCEDRARAHAAQEVVAKQHPNSSRPPDTCARP